MTASFPLGFEVDPSRYGPRGVIAEPETSAAGNVILRVGTENIGGTWSKIAHVVLVPDEADLLASTIRRLRNPRPAAQARFMVDDLQAAEPTRLPVAEGITVDLAPGRDSMGFHRASVTGPTREAVLDYVRANWGDEDLDWWADHVLARLAEAPPREVLVHLNVEVPAADTRTADQISEAILAALEVGSDDDSVRGLAISAPLAEEI